MLVLDPTSSYLMFRHYLECICLINQSDEVVSVVQLHVTVVQSKAMGQYSLWNTVLGDKL